MLGNTIRIIRIITGTTAALAAILAVAAVINLKKRKAEEENKANEENKNDEIIIRGIAGNVPLYVGLYEGFYNIAYKNSEVMDSIEEWLIRTRNLEDYESYKEIIEDYLGGYRSMEGDELKNKAVHFVSLMFEAGLIRQNTDDLDIDSVDDKEYQIFGSLSDAKEKGYKVIKAAWEYNGKVIEPGAILVS